MNLFRVAVKSVRTHIGNIEKNCEEIIEFYEKYAHKADLIVTPELSMTGYTCQDLFHNRMLITNARVGLEKLAKATSQKGIYSAGLAVGLPFEVDGELFNCVALLHNGTIIGIVPKTYLPNYGEFYEKRWFTARKADKKMVWVDGVGEVPFGNNLIFEMKTTGENVRIAFEICEDAWTPISPGRLLALNGAEIVVNLSASNEVIGKENYRRNLVSGLSASCICGYVYCSAGMYESTSDLVFSGHNLVCENGKIVAESKPFEDRVIVNDINLTKIRHDREANKSFSDCKRDFLHRDYDKIIWTKGLLEKEEILARVSMTPFVPSRNRKERCQAIFQMQVAGLMRRLEATKSKCIVVGVSGGLDSTLALLVSAKAVKNLGLPEETVLGITMPGFGTTRRTENNSKKLMKILGCQSREINICSAVRQHFDDIGHDEKIRDITYENCQARERTQILMDVANKEGGFVIGTGDLSELALGWCTYNGDHMSMYAVNTSIPKTLVRTLVDEIGHDLAKTFDGIIPVIEDIIDTPVSPELLPPNPDGTIAQITEDTVGSYILHDFFLYYTLRYGMEPEEVYTLCREAVKQNPEYAFDDAEIIKWLKTFYTRFFRQQFKRNCMPDGVKVGTVSVSPRGDLRLPSEVEFDEFIKKLEKIEHPDEDGE